MPLKPEVPHTSPLRITVMNGDLSFIREPLLLGHYRSSKLTGTEQVVDSRVKGVMKAALNMRSYPDAPGSHIIFENSTSTGFAPARPCAVIVAGLGSEGHLKSTELVYSVKQAVIAWVQRSEEATARAKSRENQAPVQQNGITLAATLLGSGGLGISAGQSALLIAKGVSEANKTLKLATKWPVVVHLKLIELYYSRATEAWRALRVENDIFADQFSIDDEVLNGPGALIRPLVASYRGAEYDIITTAVASEKDQTSTLTYTLNTNRARSEVRGKVTQFRLVRQLVAKASNAESADPEMRKSLFNLLIPPEMEPFLGGTTSLVLGLTPETAAIPWELLDMNDTNDPDELPWAIRTQLLRRLHVENLPTAVKDADRDASMLVIGEPFVTSKRYPRLPGARQEATAVVETFTKKSDALGRRVTALISSDDDLSCSPDAQLIIKKLLSSEWRIIHLAGHGDAPQFKPADDTETGEPVETRASRGVVLSDGLFLGVSEVDSLRTIPELVFVNCCHQAAGRAENLLRVSDPEHVDRAQFAANLASALIAAGVRCVITTGWAVADDIAELFARKFYDALLAGARFIEAVGAAREAAYREGGTTCNTWAAYQCYGDPDWQFADSVEDWQTSVQRIDSSAEEFASVAAPPELLVALDTIGVQAAYQGATVDSQSRKLEYLEKQFANKWQNRGDVSEAFGVAWQRVGNAEKAVTWFELAVAAEDGGATFKSAEQLANLRTRWAWETVHRSLSKRGEKSARKQTSATQARKSQAIVAEAIASLERLLAIAPTGERYSILASAHKRQAMIALELGQRKLAVEALQRSSKFYDVAVTQYRKLTSSDLHYPLMNSLALSLIEHRIHKRNARALRELLAEARATVALRSEFEADFWSVAAEAEVQLYGALVLSDLPDQADVIVTSFTSLHARASAPHKWRSLYEQTRFLRLAVGVGESPVAEQRVLKKLEQMFESWWRAKPRAPST